MNLMGSGGEAPAAVTVRARAKTENRVVMRRVFMVSSMVRSSGLRETALRYGGIGGRATRKRAVVPGVAQYSGPPIASRP